MYICTSLSPQATIMKKIFTVLCLALAIYTYVGAQVAINPSGLPPDSSSILDIQSTDKGLLIPRMRQSQIEDIQNPANGLIVFNIDVNKIFIYLNTFSSWQAIGMGPEVLYSFNCGNAITDDRDGTIYGTVQIGEQCWMSENLNIGTRIDSNLNQADNGTIEKYCYHNVEDSCDVYGGLYQWDEMMAYVTDTAARGICPQGWHVPTDFDWQILEATVDSLYNLGDPEWMKTGNRGYDAGKNLKDSTGTWYCPCHTGTDPYGFTALPGGGRDIYFNYFGHEFAAYFWTSSQSTIELANMRDLQTYSSKVGRADSFKETGVSVRCVRD
jgi:uncharacterized protein (TIGR02145 family)